MRKLIPLSASLFLLGSISAQAQSDIAKNALSCSAVYYIASSLTDDSEESGDFFIRLQLMFESIYLAFERERRNQQITNGMIADAKSEELIRLGALYSEEPKNIYTLEMQCNEWRTDVFPYLLQLIESESEIESESAIMLGVPPMPWGSETESVRWAQSKDFMDSAFQKWAEKGTPTPSWVEEELNK